MENEKTRRVRGSAIITADGEAFFTPCRKSGAGGKHQRTSCFLSIFPRLTAGSSLFMAIFTPPFSSHGAKPGATISKKTVTPYSIMKKTFKTFLAVIAAAILLLPATAAAQAPLQPKREFRGAWVQTVNGQYMGMHRDDMQRTLTSYLDAFKSYGLNAVMFQVRCEGDALYQSSYEPWSYYLTGQQGKAPDPFWDPLQWMIDECHKRGLELHAWINPYRAKTAAKHELALNHPINMYPEHFFKYGDLTLFDPGEPYNREYICRVTADILRRYDVDGIHMDDYFYPYPAAGRDIPDDKSYAQYNNGIADRADWRRHNVNELVRMMHDTIRAVKPWVKFGISPFGIYHNARRGGNVPGSATNGLENYEDLYADVLCWVNNGWVDYTMPQLYWQIGHPVADYATLINWWSENTRNRPLIIGESVENTIKYPDPQNPQSHQIYAKMNLARSLGTAGTCQWYAAAFAENRGNYAEALRQSYYSSPALPPAMPFISTQKPGKVKKLKPVWTEDGYMLFWSAPRAKKPIDEVQRYVVYRFAAGEPVNTEDASHIVDITSNNFLLLPYADGSGRYTYAVTALNRIGNESKAKKKSVKL